MHDLSAGLIIWQLMTLFLVGLWIYTLVDVARYEFKDNLKLLWVVVVLFIPFFGMLLYWTIGKNHKIIQN
ncbi:PLDc N-terminal domain-containing protein [Gramella sp. AN32]|uniref:PLDc N-terminal domain-containing protein n=1 Tax=Christiangramia antarctica TaxID=2058158 RepID=A0ABW5WYI6_9FLAO|nr:PLDc N-terminal domain-containing protein [Gramella sp. AN32]MCM4155166.1 hypothetical protein [Gramella sp. AN32]